MDWKEALGAHPYARKIGLSFDPGELAGALARVKDEWWRPHLGPYHDGGWECVAIWAPGGNLFEQRSHGAPYAKTIAALVAPHFWHVAERFACDKSRVRLMRLKPGARIFRHSDPLHEISPNVVRFHVPVVTNPEVRFMVNDVRVAMQPGEVWHVDVRFPHEVHNLGDTARVHLVLDLVRNAHLEALLRDARPLGSGRLTGYYVKHSLPRPVKEYLGIGN